MKLLVLLSIVCFVLCSCQDKKIPEQYLTNVSVVRETEKSDNARKKESPVNTETVNPVNTPDYTQTLSPSKAQYHIIVASFAYKDRARADKLVKSLKDKNYPAILLNTNKRYRVSIESFSNEAEANAARDEYRTVTDRQDIWILKLD